MIKLSEESFPHNIEVHLSFLVVPSMCVKFVSIANYIPVDISYHHMLTSIFYLTLCFLCALLLYMQLKSSKDSPLNLRSRPLYYCC